MDSSLISSIAQKVFQKFPEVRGSVPKVKPQGSEQFLLIFEGHAQTADGKTIARTVRVVASSSGKIIKMTTSR
jgi:hypothetical protein